MATEATTFVPSTTNTTGTVIGAMAGSLVVGYLTKAVWMASFAATVGLTPVAIAGIGGIVATALVNYGATHIAELRELNNLAKLIPKTYSSPTDFPDIPPQTPTNVSNINKG